MSSSIGQKSLTLVGYYSVGSASHPNKRSLSACEFAGCDDSTFAWFLFWLNAMQVGRRSTWVSGLSSGFLPPSQVSIRAPIFDKLGFWFGVVWLRFGCGSVQGFCRSVETLEWGWKAGCAVSGLGCKNRDLILLLALVSLMRRRPIPCDLLSWWEITIMHWISPSIFVMICVWQCQDNC